MNTITTLSHCLVKDGKAYEGTKADIIAQVCIIRWEKRQPFFTVKGYPEHQLHSFGLDWTEEELHNEVTEDVFKELSSRYGFMHYRNIR